MIKIYTTPTCVYCKMAKEYFGKNNLAFEEHDVSKDEASLNEMVAKSHQMGVPVIDVNGTIVVGFDKGAIESALGTGK
ncbi:MAG TPA: glutaredoxin domain-containing protein [Candidatus Tyrphobacter sp.]|nr:glutaredoxin domain-containing protein [Candidatus Tyrphobacter sp.]